MLAERKCWLKLLVNGAGRDPNLQGCVRRLVSCMCGVCRRPVFLAEDWSSPLRDCSLSSRRGPPPSRSGAHELLPTSPNWFSGLAGVYTSRHMVG